MNIPILSSCDLKIDATSHKNIINYKLECLCRFLTSHIRLLTWTSRSKTFFEVDQALSKHVANDVRGQLAYVAYFALSKVHIATDWAVPVGWRIWIWGAPLTMFNLPWTRFIRRLFKSREEVRSTQVEVLSVFLSINVVSILILIGVLSCYSYLAFFAG